MKQRFLAPCLLAAWLAASLPLDALAASRGRPGDDDGRDQPRLSAEEKKKLRDRIGELEQQLKDLKKKVDSGRLAPEDERRLDRFLASERPLGRPEMDGRPPLRGNGAGPMERPERPMRERFGGMMERHMGPPPGPRPPMPPGPQRFDGPRFERRDIGPRWEGRDLPELGPRPPLPPPGRFQGPPPGRPEGADRWEGPTPGQGIERPSRPPGPEGRRPGQIEPSGPERPQPND